MKFTPSQELVDANIRRNELTESHKALTEKINTNEKLLEDIEAGIVAAEEVYGDALTQEVLKNTESNRAATKSAKQDIERLKEQHSETRDILEATKLVRERVTRDLKLATNKARIELNEYRSRNFQSFGWEKDAEVLQALNDRVVKHYLANGMSSSPEAALNRLVQHYLGTKSDARKVASEIFGRLSGAVTTDQFTVGE
ncbi:MAG: hypothetical protein JAY74_18700 [Candidatus Thiodiazotropha taylori]|nr:hypothetical protein [Candidatus Thiodiazotropha taylori]